MASTPPLADEAGRLHRGPAVRDVRPWVLELSRMLPSLLRSYVPGRGLDARARERLIVAVAAASGGSRVAWAHAGWQVFIGDAGDQLLDEDDALLAYARECVEAGRPVDTSALEEQLSHEAVRSARATVAHASIGGQIDAAAGAVVAHLRGRGRGGVADLAGRVALGSLAVPLAGPTVAVGVLTRAAARWAPPAPPVVAPAHGEGNLLVDLLAESVPRMLAHTGVRSLVGLLRGPLVLAVRAGRSDATVRIDRSLVTIAEGTARDAMLLIDGDIEPLLTSAAGALARRFGQHGLPSS